MKQYRVLYLFATLLLFFKGCQKENFSLPADVRIEFSTNPATALEGDLEFFSSGLMIHSFRFLGERNTGNIDFIKELDPGSVFSILSGNNPEILVNIPRGLYEEFNIQISVSEGTGDISSLNQEIETWLGRLEDYDDDDDGDDDDDDGDDDDDNGDDDDDNGDDTIFELQKDLGSIISQYLENVQPGMIMEGTLSIPDHDYSVYFVVEDDLLLPLQVQNREMTRQINFQEGMNTLQINLDPEKWFAPLSEQILTNAWFGRVDDERIIFIHKKINPEIYTILLSRLEVAFSASKL